MWVKYKHKIFSLNIYIFKVSILHQNYISIPTYQIALTSHFYRAQFRNSGNIKFLSKILETSNNGYSVFAGGWYYSESESPLIGALTMPLFLGVLAKQSANW